MTDKAMVNISRADEQTSISSRLAARKPEDVDSLLVSQASSHGVVLRAGSRLRPIYDERGTFLGNDLTPTGWYAQGPTAGKERTAEIVAKAMTPAPVETIEEWLAELSVITAKRADDEFTDTLRVDAYSRRLGGYPADVVKAALLDRTWKFWPTWAELSEVCDKAVAARRAMARALDAKEAARDESLREDAERDRVSGDRAAEIMEEFGFRPKRFGGGA